MKLTILGASGRVGRQVAQLALARGHEVTVCVRDAARWSGAPAVRVRVVGSATDMAAVREAIRGADVVVSAVGARDVSQPTTVVTDSVRTLVEAMRAEGLGRAVTVGAAGLLPLPDGRLAGEGNLPPFLVHAFNDHRGALTSLQESGLDWVVVCPPFIPDGERTGQYRLFEERPLEGLGRVSSGDVADLVLRVAEEPRFRQVRVGLSY